VRATRLRYAPTRGEYSTPVRHYGDIVGAMPAATSEILNELDRLLEPQRFDDYAVNGLQVPGAERVSTLATGVSAHAELFELAASERADLLLVHHGLFWGSELFAIDAALKRRLQLLFDASIALAAYHLPLDAHPELGNNALLARGLGASEFAPFAMHRGEAIGVLATLPGEGVAAAELVDRVRESTAREPLTFDAGPKRVRVVAVVSGAGADYLGEAVAAGADAFITGEPAERAMAQAREARVHFIAAGHYATETFGVRNLGKLIAERFGVRHVFLDVPNPV
jgi:dinuclear metal center YbgI/SA1388 family protein